MAAVSALAVSPNLGTQKHVGTLGRAGKEMGPGSASSGVLTCAVSKEHQQDRNPGHGGGHEASSLQHQQSSRALWGGKTASFALPGVEPWHIPSWLTILNFLGFEVSVG